MTSALRSPRSTTSHSGSNARWSQEQRSNRNPRSPRSPREDGARGPIDSAGNVNAANAVLRDIQAAWTDADKDIEVVYEEYGEDGNAAKAVAAASSLVPSWTALLRAGQTEDVPVLRLSRTSCALLLPGAVLVAAGLLLMNVSSYQE